MLAAAKLYQALDMCFLNRAVVVFLFYRCLDSIRRVPGQIYKNVYIRLHTLVEQYPQS